MKPQLSRTINGVSLLVIAAVIGYLLLTAPPTIIDYYDKAAAHGIVWAYLYLATVTLGCLLLFGSFGYVAFRLWRNTRRAERKRILSQTPASEMSVAQQQRSIEDNLQQTAELSDEPTLAAESKAELNTAITEIKTKLASGRLEIVAFGTISSGKSALLNALANEKLFQSRVRGGTTVTRQEVSWPSHDKVTLVDTPGLGEVDGESHVAIARDAARSADVILFVVDGPIRASEAGLLRILAQMEKRLIVCLNKADWFTEDDQKELLNQLREQTSGMVLDADIVLVRADTTTQNQVRIKPDGSEVVQQVDLPPDISLLAKRLLHAVKKDGDKLLMANVLWRSRGLVEEARDTIEEALDTRARQVINTYMWRAGTAAAIVPVPGIDAAAGLGISAAMVMEIAKVYRQPIDFKSAKRLIEELGKNLVAILGVNAITPVIAGMIGSAVKAAPGIGTIAGGLLHGLVQALVTRWIGLVFIEYFKHEMAPPEGGIARLAREAWKEVTKREELIALARNGVKHLRGAGKARANKADIPQVPDSEGPTTGASRSTEQQP